MADVFSHTYEFNELYQRPIFPLGQVFDSAPVLAINQFRAFAGDYGANGVSWWDWQSAATTQFQAVFAPIASVVGFVPQRTVASIGRGAKGDLVVWAQEHLASAGLRLTVDGDFGRSTQRAVTQFQSVHHLPVSGVINPATWNSLLRFQPASIKWTIKKHGLTAIVARAGARAGYRAGTRDTTLPVPLSASLPATRDELGGAPGQGRPHTASR